MPFVESNDTGGFVGYVQPQPEKVSPSMGETFGAAFRLENDVVAAYQLATEPNDFKPDPLYNVVTKMRDWDAANRTNLWDNYRDNFLGVRSDAEFMHILGKINQEQKDKETLSNAGAGGIIASLTAGVLSPTMLMPFIGPERGVAAAVKGAALGGLAGAAQEIPLQLAQETRTSGESAFSIAAATVLGGVLGGTVGALRQGEFDKLVKQLEVESGMVRSTIDTPIPGSVGAAAVPRALDEYAGRLKAARAAKVADWLGPVTRVINQTEDRTASWFMSQLADAGLRMEGNVQGLNTSAGGTVESLIKPYYGAFAQVTEGLDANFAKYIYGEGQVPGIAPNMRASMTGFWDNSKMSKSEFRAEVSKALRNKDTSPVPEVAATAKLIREKLLDPVLREAQRTGVLGEVKDISDPSYYHRSYRREVIEARTNEFIDKLTQHYSEKLNGEFGEQLARLSESERRDAQLVEDLVRPKEEVDAARAELKARENELLTGKRVVTGKTVDDYFKQIIEREKKTDLDVGQTSRELADWELRDARTDAMVLFLKENGINIASQSDKFKLYDVFRDPWWGEPGSLRRVANNNENAARLEEMSKGLPERKDIDKFLQHATNLNEEKPFNLEAILKIFPDEFKERARKIALDPSYSTPGGPDAELVQLAEEAYPAIAEIKRFTQEIPDSSAAGFDTAQKFTPDFDDVLKQLVSTVEKPTSLEQFISPDLIQRIQDISDLRSQARLARKAGDKEAQADFLKQARDLEQDAGDSLVNYRQQLSEIRRRQQGLARAAVALEERQMKKLSAIEKIEDVNQRELERVSRAGYRILNQLDTVSDAALEKEMKALSTRFDDLRETLERVDERKVKLAEGEQPDTIALLGLDERSQTLTGRMSDIARDMEAIDTIDRGSVRAAITEALTEIQERAMNSIERRLARENKLIEAAGKLAPEQVATRIAALKGASKERRLNFLERARERGADNINLDARSADFTAYARERATETTQKILGSPIRLPLNDILQGPRGPELARVLDIPSTAIEDFLENDVERVLRSYLRSMAPDIEMARKFGSVSGAPIFKQMEEEYFKKLEALNGTELKGKELEKAQAKIRDDYTDNVRDLNAVVGRLRGTWGLPDNPDGMAYRMGRAVMNLNVLRLMGGTLIASIPDAARPIQRYGLTRTFRDAFLPMVTNWKQLQVSAREAKLAGAALDAIMHTRAQSINDVLDDYGRHTKFERGLEYATNHLGSIALFDQWTVAMKQLSSSVIINKITDSLDIIYGGAKASAKETKEAQEFLASKGLMGDLGQRIHGQLNTPEGGNRVNGVLMPNTESWVDRDAQQAFRGALASEINNTIITPGVERPLWMDASMLGRILGQFKSFGMSSTYKVLLSGVQQHDMAFFTGTMVSLALGALSYYLSAVSAGGDTYQKMLKAGPGKFADEAINRSGVLGIYSDAQRFLERIPATKPYVSFSGERTTRRGGDDLVDVVLGPTFGLATTAAKAVAGMDDPTKQTLHNIRQLMPWQNLLIWRRVLDEIEKQSNLPERRN